MVWASLRSRSLDEISRAGGSGTCSKNRYQRPETTRHALLDLVNMTAFVADWMRLSQRPNRHRDEMRRCWGGCVSTEDRLTADHATVPVPARACSRGTADSGNLQTHQSTLTAVLLLQQPSRPNYNIMLQKGTLVLTSPPNKKKKKQKPQISDPDDDDGVQRKPPRLAQLLRRNSQSAAAARGMTCMFPKRQGIFPFA